jgi:3-keto-L-gulonate-6-phosphate decarboxylase
LKTIVQISLDITNIPEAIETAQVALRAGVDWLEVGTPLIIAEGMNGVRALRKGFPDVPIVADLKTRHLTTTLESVGIGVNRSLDRSRSTLLRIAQ